MGQRLIISEEERSQINKMYGLLNEQDNDYYINKKLLENVYAINEIGDASAKPYKWEALPKSEAGEGHSYWYKFTTDNGVKYEAEFWYSPLDGKKRKLLYLFEFAPSDAYDGGDDGNPLVTNEGTPLRVMSTIVQILKDFIDKNPTATVQYSAGKNFSGDARRGKLYMAYVKKLLPSNYKVTSKGDDVLIQPKYKREMTRLELLNQVAEKLERCEYNI